MLLTEYNEARQMELFKEEGRAEGRVEGRAEGREEGQNMLGNLISKLLFLGRVEDAARSAEDPKYREKLFREFQIQ